MLTISGLLIHSCLPLCDLCQFLLFWAVSLLPWPGLEGGKLSHGVWAQCCTLVSSEWAGKEHIHAGTALEMWFSLMGPERKGSLRTWGGGQGICRKVWMWTIGQNGAVRRCVIFLLRGKEPEEGKLYKVRQGLMTVMVENSYWSGEWGSRLTFWHQIGREDEANACGSHLRHLRLKLSLSLPLFILGHYGPTPACSSKPNSLCRSKHNFNKSSNASKTYRNQAVAILCSKGWTKNMMGYGALNPDLNIVLEHLRRLCVCVWGGGVEISEFNPQIDQRWTNMSG